MSSKDEILQRERFLTFNNQSKLIMHVMAYNVLLFFHPKLQMAASQATVLRNKQKLEDKIEEKRKNLNAYEAYIKPTDDDIICVLEAKISEKEKESKNCYWIQCMTILKKFLLTTDYD